MMQDALRQEVVLGNTYGYSASQSSRVTVVTGRAIKETKSGRISLEVISRRHFLYGEEHADWSSVSEAATVNVHPCHLFPVTLP